MTDPDVTRELVELFRDGATVAELVRHARRRLGGDGPARVWADAVRHAFGLDRGGWYMLSATESVGTGRVPDAKLTWGFLRFILANRPAWDTDAGDSARWYDGLPKTPWDDLMREAADKPDISPEGWAALSEQDRQRVRMLQVSHRSLGEDVQLLAALAERLQRKLNALEQRTPQPAAVGDA